MITIRKIRVNNYEPVLRAIFSDEPDTFFAPYVVDGKNQLDFCIEQAKAIIGDNLFFRLENEHGALMGFISVTPDVNSEFIPQFHIKENFRGQEYLQAFWALVSEIYNNAFFTSVGAVNYSPGVSDWLKTEFFIQNKLEYTGINFKIIKL